MHKDDMFAYLGCLLFVFVILGIDLLVLSVIIWLYDTITTLLF